MPIVQFNSVTDGLEPRQRHRDQFTTDKDLDDDRLWVPYVEGVWFQPCQFNVTSGGFSNVLKILPGSKLPPHYHVATVHGYTLRGTWHYLEHDWVAVPGTYIFEPAGEAHTLVVPADATEPMMTFFVLAGALIYLDSIENGKVVGYDDGFTLLELARKHYRETGLDMESLEALIR